MVQVEVIDVAESSDGTAVLLFDRQSVRVLPVFVGPAEAAALSHALVAKTFSRPLTYELVQGMLSSLGAEVRHVRIESLQRPTGIFIGVVTLELAAEEKEVDSRPSDAINIALRCGAPIYVAPSVMEVAIEVASTKSTTEFRPRGAESLASRSLRFSPPGAAEAESIEPIVSTNDESLQEVSTPESQAMTPDITRERIKLLSDYVVALAVDADG
jgi:hypothetical protein